MGADEHAAGIRVDRIAMRIAAGIISDGNDMLDDYKKLYEDCKWIIEVVRKLNEVLSGLTRNNYISSLSKINEDINYIKNASSNADSVLGTTEAWQEYTRLLEDVKAACKENGDDDKENGAQSFTDAVKAMLEYSKSCEESFVNAFRNRYLDDEDVLTETLDTANDCMNDVLHKTTVH